MVKIQKFLRTPQGIGLVSALCCGVVTHGFALVNVLHNYDNILQQPKGLGVGILFGRWLLSALGDFNDVVFDLNYNLPLVNGLAFLLFIALSAAVLIDVLKIKRTGCAILVGCLMATFPTVGATMAFRYTAPYYGLALLLAVLAAWEADRKRCWGWLLSALLLTLSMGLYQAYPPVTISLFVLVLMRDALDEQAQLKPLIFRGLRYCASLLLAVAAYFVMLKVVMAAYSSHLTVSLQDYQGVSTMGQISLRELPFLIKQAWLSAVLFPVHDYCSLTSTTQMKLVWTLLVGTTLVLGIYLLLHRRPKPLLGAFFVVMGLVFPLAVNFIMVMCPDSVIYTIMVYSFVLVGCAPLMLLELLPKPHKGFVRTICTLAALVVFYNGYYTNFNYMKLYYANRQVENYLSGLVAQIRMTPGYTPEKTWAFLGDLDDPKMYELWYEEPTYGGIIGCSAEGLMNAGHSKTTWFDNYIGYGVGFAPQEQCQMLAEDPAVKQMPTWPSAGSIQVVGEYVVVKFQDLTALPK